MKNKLFTYMIFPVLILLFWGLYGFSVNRNNNKTIKKVEIEFKEGDNYFLTHQMVNKLLIQNSEFVENQLKSSLDLYELEKEVLKSPFVENATIYVTPKGLLKTYIKQRSPIARVILGNKSFYVDKHGVNMPLSSNFSARVPLVSGLKNHSDLDKVRKLITSFSSDEFLKKEIVAVQKNKENDFLLFVRSGDYKINIGDIKNIDIKFEKLKAFYNKALSDKTLGDYKVINIKYNNQVVCSKQQKDGE